MEINEQTAERIANALEALAAAEIHRLHTDFLKTAHRSKNKGYGEEMMRKHPCPLCKK